MGTLYRKNSEPFSSPFTTRETGLPSRRAAYAVPSVRADSLRFLLRKNKELISHPDASHAGGLLLRYAGDGTRTRNFRRDRAAL